MDLGPDPIFMYCVVRRSLNLSAGKVGGQCGHAVHYLMRAYHNIWTPIPEAELEAHHARRALTEKWDASPSHGKIILGATDSEFERVKLENPHHFLVVDLGHTEVEPNTETTIGLWPMHKSQRSGLLKRLRLL